MTGTPGGVGLFMDPKTFLNDGDEVSITISGIGTLTNVMKFE
jgi:transcription initiation factor TFIIH subunit 2